jgi:hypothetical protein
MQQMERSYGVGTRRGNDQTHERTGDAPDDPTFFPERRRPVGRRVEPAPIWVLVAGIVMLALAVGPRWAAPSPTGDGGVGSGARSGSTAVTVAADGTGSHLDGQPGDHADDHTNGN